MRGNSFCLSGSWTNVRLHIRRVGNVHAETGKGCRISYWFTFASVLAFLASSGDRGRPCATTSKIAITHLGCRPAFWIVYLSNYISVWRSWTASHLPTWTPFPPALKIRPEWSDHKSTVLSTAGMHSGCTEDASLTTTFRGGVNHMFSGGNRNLSWVTLEDRRLSWRVLWKRQCVHSIMLKTTRHPLFWVRWWNAILKLFILCVRCSKKKIFKSLSQFYTLIRRAFLDHGI